MVGSEYQAEVPSCICHYKDGEKGDAAFYLKTHRITAVIFPLSLANVMNAKMSVLFLCSV